MTNYKLPSFTTSFAKATEVKKVSEGKQITNDQSTMTNSQLDKFFFRKSTFSFQFKRGQTLVMLLVLMTAGVIITSAAVIMIIVNSQASSKFALGEDAYAIAESGAENAIIRLIRNPSYVGETLTVGNGTATITVSGSSTITIVSEGVRGNFRRKVQVVGSYDSNNIFTPTSWTEID